MIYEYLAPAIFDETGETIEWIEPPKFGTLYNYEGGGRAIIEGITDTGWLRCRLLQSGTVEVLHPSELAVVEH